MTNGLSPNDMFLGVHHLISFDKRITGNFCDIYLSYTSVIFLCNITFLAWFFGVHVWYLLLFLNTVLL